MGCPSRFLAVIESRFAYFFSLILVITIFGVSEPSKLLGYDSSLAELSPLLLVISVIVMCFSLKLRVGLLTCDDFSLLLQRRVVLAFSLAGVVSFKLSCQIVTSLTL